MIKILILFLTVFSGLNAFSWTKEVSCQESLSGNLIVDRSDTETYSGYSYQVVITGQALEHLKSFGVIPEYRVNAKNEFISSLFLYDGNYRFFIGERQGVQNNFWFIKEGQSMHLIVDRDDRIGGPRGTITDFYFNNCSFYRP
jgi:hypothetical protein